MALFCQICQSDGPHTDHKVCDLMFGVAGDHEYFECGTCGTVQLKTIPTPELLAAAYPKEYRALQSRSSSRLSRWVQTHRDRAATGSSSLMGSLANLTNRDPLIPVLRQLRIPKHARILDVGCGFGYLLDRLLLAGFPNVSGLDPYMPSGYWTEQGVLVLDVELADAPSEYDLIMFNHSLEHVTDIAGTLSIARKKLNPGSLCLVRIPTCSSAAWAEYGVFWAQLDAPRHIVIPSRRGMEILAERCGFALERTIDDSTAYHQFFVSEAYKRGLSPAHVRAQNLYSKAEVRGFERRAAKLNATHRGDQAAFFLRAH